MCYASAVLAAGVVPIEWWGFVEVWMVLLRRDAGNRCGNERGASVTARPQHTSWSLW